MDEMDDSLLTRDAPDEEQVRLFRVYSEFAQGIVRLGRAIFLEIDTVVDYVQAFVSDIEQARDVSLGLF